VTGVAPRWGWLATALWSVVVMAVFFATQMAFVLWYAAATMGHIHPDRMLDELAKLENNGDILAVATFLSTPACLLAILAIIKLKRGATFEDTLALRVLPREALVRWVVAVVAFAALADALSWLLGIPIVPPAMELAYRSAEGKAALWVALVLAAPVFEEVFFRGFVVTGLAHSRLGASGAVIIASLVWAGIHSQYDLYGIATIFFLGLIFGAARVKTGSVLAPIAMHMVTNIIATAEAALLQGTVPGVALLGTVPGS
jgi:membrane protease YdiL (CAAX protease family)